MVAPRLGGVGERRDRRGHRGGEAFLGGRHELQGAVAGFVVREGDFGGGVRDFLHVGVVRSLHGRLRGARGVLDLRHVVLVRTLEFVDHVADVGAGARGHVLRLVLADGLEPSSLRRGGEGLRVGG